MRLSLPLLASALVACASSDGGGDLDGQLDQPRRATIAPGETTTIVAASARVADGIDYGEARLDVRNGSLVAHVDLGPDHDDRLVIDELRLTYADVVLPPAHFHQGQALTGITARLKAPLSMRVVRASDGAIWGAGEADVRLDWSLLVDGDAHPLLAQTLTDLHLELVISDQDGTPRFDLQVVRPGVMWSWANVVTLGDVDLQTTAYASID